MFWFSCQQSQPKYQNFSHFQMIQVTLPENTQEIARNYEELLAYCKNLQKQNQQLKNEIISLKYQSQSKPPRKIKRRIQDELVKNFACLYPHCKKQYASELALNLHMKIKHNAGSKRDRMNAINKILTADAEGREQPQIHINLPPNYRQLIKTQQKPQKPTKPTRALPHQPPKQQNQ